MDNACDICAKTAKYKCPRCFIHYCSVPCSQIHKKDSCEDKASQKRDEDDKKMGESKREVGGRSGISKVKLELLEKDEEINNLLANRHLRDLLMTIDKAENAEEIMHEAMQEPIFVEFADACLKIVDPIADEKE